MASRHTPQGLLLLAAASSPGMKESGIAISSPQTPCHGQTADEVKAWLQANVCIGATVVIRHTQAGFLQYTTATVTRIGRGRFEVDTLGPANLSTAGLTFYFSGKNCWSPKGKTCIVIPSKTVLAACS